MCPVGSARPQPRLSCPAWAPPPTLGTREEESHVQQDLEPQPIQLSAFLSLCFSHLQNGKVGGG